MVAQVIFFVFLVVGVLVMAIYIGTQPIAPNHNALATPLLQGASIAGDHRVEAAVRDAAEGCTTCSFCVFENFKRFPFCSLCGQELQQDAQAVAASVIADRERTTTRTTPFATLTQRQKRARKRREWIRKLDVEGKLFWFRESSGPEDNEAPLLPGYCLRFQTRNDPLEEIGDPDTSHSSPERTSCTLKRSGSVEIEYPVMTRRSSVVVMSNECVVVIESEMLDEPGHDNVQPRTPLAVGSVLQDLTSSVRNMQIQLIESSASDPAESPLESIQPRNSSSLMAIGGDVTSQNFPAKYAEFVIATVALMAPAEKEILKFNVSRELLLEDSMESLSVIPEAYIRSSMRINFVNEPGLDAGGLQREWFVLLNECLADSKSGVFRCVNETEQTFYLNPNSLKDIGDDHLMYYFATGRLVGRALLEGQVLGFHLALPLLKIILGQPLTFQDLEYFDPEAYKSMLWIKENAGAEHLGLDYSVTEKRGEKMVVVDLVQNGRNMDVTDENKELYLESKFRYLLFESVSSQLYVFLKGLYEVIPQATLLRFDPEELDYVLCGSDVIDVDDWEHSTQVSASLKGTRKYLVKWFWEIVKEMPNEYRQRLLHFATGSSRVPIAGFSALTSNDGRLCPFTLKLNESVTSKGYIWSHACFNRLDLPVLRSKQQFETSLYATLRTELNGFTTD